MLRPVLVAVTSLIALAVGETETQRCFLTNDWRDGVIVPGEPNVLIWEGSANRDVLLDMGTGNEAAFAGAIARNVSQGSVFWIPPKDITADDPDQIFEIQLWDMETGFGCSSPSFKFAEVSNNTAEDNGINTEVAIGPFVTTAVSILNTGWVTVTATVATYESDGPIFEQAVTGSITATDGEVTTGSFSSLPTEATAGETTAAATATSTSDSSKDKDNGDGPNVLAIALGTVGGVLAVALVVLSVVLCRIKRKRANRKARADSVTEAPKDISPLSTPDSQMSEVRAASAVTATEVSGDTARHEMLGDSTAPQELPTENMHPVELPADEIPPPSYPGHERDMEVSPTTGGDSRRSSMSFDKGTFTVSPLSHRGDRKE